MLVINWGFNHSKKNDSIELYIVVNGRQASVEMDADSALILFESVATLAPGMIEGLKKRRAELKAKEEGEKDQDLHEEFDSAQWEKLMRIKQEREEDGRKDS